MKSTLDNWFLWRKYIEEKKKPWQRDFTNVEFLKSEANRVNICGKWHDKFIRASKGSPLEPIEMYVLPTRIDYTKSQSIQSHQTVKVLSALRNCLKSSTIALFEGAVPKDYSLIRVKSSLKTYIQYGNIKDPFPVKYALIVNNWEELLIDYLYYLDTKKPEIIRELLIKNFIGPSPFPEAFQSPLLSSPPIHQVGGGISLASEFEVRGFAKDVCDAIQFVLPPEYRSIAPPKSASGGKWEEIAPNLNAHVAEIIIHQNSIVKSTVSNSPDRLMEVANKRLRYSGELSSVGGLFTGITDKVKGTPTLIHNFFNFDIALCDVESLYNHQNPINELLPAIEEDHFIAIVNQRQINPILDMKDERLLKTSKDLLKWFEGDVKSYGKRTGDASAEVLKLASGISLDNISETIMRESQSIARSKYHETVEDEDLYDSSKNYQKRITLLMEKPEVQEGIRELPHLYGRGKHEMKKVKSVAIIGSLKAKPGASLSDLWDYLEPKSIFENQDEMINLVEVLRQKGRIYYNNGYFSVE